MRFTFCTAVLVLVMAVAACRRRTPPLQIDPDQLRIYPRNDYSGAYDPYFGAGGKQLTDLAWINVAPMPRVSDAVRFLHRRPDGNYLAIGRSEECDTDWNVDGRSDGCREFVSVALYNHDGIRIDTAGMANLRWLNGYTDTVPSPRRSGLTYFSVASTEVDPRTGVDPEAGIDPITGVNINSQRRFLPQSVRAEDSCLLPSGTALVLAEEDWRNANCLDYEMPNQPFPPVPPPVLPPLCMHWRKSAILGFNQNLDLDLNLLLASRATLRAYSNSNGYDGNCEKTHFTALAGNADRIFIGGYREDRCNTSGPAKFTPFVIALLLDGTRDTAFGTNGSWSPPWPQNDTEGGVISDLQIDAAGNLLVLGGRWTAPTFTTVATSVLPAGQQRTGFGNNGELRFADVQFDLGPGNMKLAVANQAAFVFSRHGRQVAHIRDVGQGLRNSAYGPAGTGVYAAEPDIASLPGLAGVPAPRLLLHDLVPVCSGGVALVGSTLEASSRPAAILLNRSGRRAANFHDTGATANPGVVFDNYAGMMPHTRWGFGYAAMFDARENKLLIGGSAGSEQNRASAHSLPLFDFAISARQIRCVDVD